MTRFAPNGELLAATDEARISILKFQKNFMQYQDSEMKASLSHTTHLTGHSREVTDM